MLDNSCSPSRRSARCCERRRFSFERSIPGAIVPFDGPAAHFTWVTRADSIAASSLPPRWTASSIALAWALPALLAGVYAIVTLRMTGAPVTWRVVAAALAAWYTWALITPVIERLAERWRMQRAVDVRRLALHLVAGIAATGVQAATITVLTPFVSGHPEQLSRVFVFWFVTLLPAGIVVYAAVVGIRTAEFFHADSLARTRIAEKLSVELEKAKLSALRSQLQPHFVFNTLNAVIALVRAHENVEAADALIMLSDLLRATLRTSSAAEVRLDEELEFTRQYLGIERLRFGDRLTVHLEDADGLQDLMVPTFLLQPFVENAIKHGLKDRREGGLIAVTFARDEYHLRVRIADNGVGLPAEWAERSATGYGVSNARARLEHLYGREASLRLGAPATGTGTVVDIAVPLKSAPDMEFRS
jgi:two-component system LytT family sensor kinase